ncbi:MAG: mechanosensitive ion channel family protein [Weeksellaceae bacterium]
MNQNRQSKQRLNIINYQLPSSIFYLIFFGLSHVLFAQDSIIQDKINNQAITGQITDYEENYFHLKSLNEGIPIQDISGNLQTPFKALAFFDRNVKRDSLELASGVLNFNLIPKEEHFKKDSLAYKLHYLLQNMDMLSYDDLPNRADGLVDPPLGKASKLEGSPRKSILLGKIQLQDKKIPIYLERVKVDNQSPIWIFSAETVEYIEPLYFNYKPAEIEQYLPSFLKNKIWGINIWQLIALIIGITLAYIVSWLITRLIKWIINRFTDRDIQMADMNKDVNSIQVNFMVYIIRKLTVPFTLFLITTILYLSSRGAISFLGNIANSLINLVNIAFAISLAWFVMSVVEVGFKVYAHFKISQDDEIMTQIENRRKTNISIGVKIVKAIAFLWALIYILGLYIDITGIGRVLLTSAGIIGVILGFAAQSVIGNFIAGIQVAITKPVKIGDTVIIEGEWASVEDLRYTYAVIKTWDNRRLILPMKKLVVDTIENWSHTMAPTSSGIFLYVDYTADVDKIRGYFINLVKQHRLWNNEVEPELIVYASDRETFTLRAKVSSDTPNHTWNMECEIREQMLKYLSQNEDVLPKQRLIVTSNNSIKG